ncbi:MAG: hypothetical protein OEY87_10890, partial [Gammaproteobacteria bacterium]|nr:hypothetical protein [Gammaproteobacteria bacterium]
GDAGTITVNATGTGGLTVQGGASISSESRAFGKAGNIVINASDINLSRNGKPFGAISSQSAYAGDAGNINIHSTGNIDIQGGFEIASSVQGTGTGGNVTVSADNAITISGDNSGIASATTQPSDQVKNELAYLFASANFDGLISDINGYYNSLGGPGTLLLPDASMYDVLGALHYVGLINLGAAAWTFPALSAGNAGTISITASALNMDNLSRVTSSTTSDGNGGTINIAVDTLAMTTSAEIRSRSGLINATTELPEVGAGIGGDITINATESVSMQSGASISSSSQSTTGNAGNIIINAGNTLDMVDSGITTEASAPAASNGGNITLQAIKRIYLTNSEIKTDSGSKTAGGGSGGDINIDPEFVILKSSNISTSAYGGSGGDITIIADNFLQSPDSIIDASSVLSQDGEINISSPDEDVSDDLAVLPDNYLDVTSLIGERCGAKSGSSSLVNAGPAGMAVDPDGYLPSFAAAEHQNDEETVNAQAASSGKHWSSTYIAHTSLDLTQVSCNKF